MSQPDPPKFYSPTGTSPQLIIQSLNDYLGSELSLPGSFSPAIFYSDLKEHLATNKKTLAKLVQKINQLEQKGERVSYLDFFEQSRGRSRPDTTDHQKEIWKVFEQGSIMIYFEPIFLRFLEATELTREENVILEYIKVLSQVPIVRWNEVVKGIGACCYQFFGKEPDLYAHLIFRTKDDGPESMTDDELLLAIGSKLSPTRYRDQVCLDDSRSAIIKRYKEINV